jgi:hypothetical protein
LCQLRAHKPTNQPTNKPTNQQKTHNTEHTGNENDPTRPNEYLMPIEQQQRPQQHASIIARVAGACPPPSSTSSWSDGDDVGCLPSFYSISTQSRCGRAIITDLIFLVIIGFNHAIA